MTFTPHEHNVDEVREYLRGDITAADALAVLEAETGPDGKARGTVVEAASKRAEQLAVTPEPEPVTPEDPAVTPDAEPVTPSDAEPVAETDPPSPIGADGIPVLTQPAADAALADAVVALAASTVQPHRYEGDQWAVGQRAPQAVVRAMNRVGQYGSPRPGDLSPGERGDIVVQAGDTITAAVRRILG